MRALMQDAVCLDPGPVAEGAQGNPARESVARADDGQLPGLDAEPQSRTSDPLTFTPRQLLIPRVTASKVLRIRGRAWLAFLGIDRDELEGIAWLALVEAARNWNPAKWPTGQEGYSNYLVTQVIWRVNHELTARSAAKRVPAATQALVSLDAPAGRSKERGLVEALAMQPPAAASFESEEWTAAVLSRLPEGERECVRLVWIEGRTMAAAGQIVGITQQGVDCRLQRARERLRNSRLIRQRREY